MDSSRWSFHVMWVAAIEIAMIVIVGDAVRAYPSDYAIEGAPGGGAVTTMAISNIGSPGRSTRWRSSS